MCWSKLNKGSGRFRAEGTGGDSQALQKAGGVELKVLLCCRSPAGPAAVEWLCSSLCGLCEQAGDISCGDTELAQRILSGKALGWVQGRTSEVEPCRPHFVFPYLISLGNMFFICLANVTNFLPLKND